MCVCVWGGGVGGVEGGGRVKDAKVANTICISCGRGVGEKAAGSSCSHAVSMVRFHVSAPVAITTSQPVVWDRGTWLWK